MKKIETTRFFLCVNYKEQRSAAHSNQAFVAAAEAAAATSSATLHCFHEGEEEEEEPPPLISSLSRITSPRLAAAARASLGSSFPGFRIPLGSKIALIEAARSRASAGFDKRACSAFILPRPCSAETDPRAAAVAR